MFVIKFRTEVAILCEFDYIKSNFVDIRQGTKKREVAILCEFDYIKSLLASRQPHRRVGNPVAILCEFDYIKSTVTQCL